eukprot:COSAG01_NODE_2518_length_7524_cov_2.305724_6_plen_281_part_00
MVGPSERGLPWPAAQRLAAYLQDRQHNPAHVAADKDREQQKLEQARLEAAAVRAMVMAVAQRSQTPPGGVGGVEGGRSLVHSLTPPSRRGHVLGLGAACAEGHRVKQKNKMGVHWQAAAATAIAGRPSMHLGDGPGLLGQPLYGEAAANAAQVRQELEEAAKAAAAEAEAEAAAEAAAAAAAQRAEEEAAARRAQEEAAAAAAVAEKERADAEQAAAAEAAAAAAAAEAAEAEEKVVKKTAAELAAEAEEAAELDRMQAEIDAEIAKAVAAAKEAEKKKD